jgi:hypothetical protein
MTTTVKVTSHNYPALVTAVDRYAAPETRTQLAVLHPEDGEQSFYCTTTRTLEIVDLECDDPRAEKKPAATVEATSTISS